MPWSTQRRRRPPRPSGTRASPQGTVNQKMLFMSPDMWLDFCQQVHKRKGTVVMMCENTSISFHIITYSKLDYSQGKQNKARQGKWAATGIQGWVEGQGKAI